VRGRNVLPPVPGASRIRKRTRGERETRCPWLPSARAFSARRGYLLTRLQRAARLPSDAPSARGEAIFCMRLQRAARYFLMRLRRGYLLMRLQRAARYVFTRLQRAARYVFTRLRRGSMPL